MPLSSAARVETKKPDPARRYVVTLGWQTYKFFSPSFPLNILVDTYIQVGTSILVHPVLVDTEERVVSSHEADPGEVVHACLACGGASINVRS